MSPQPTTDREFRPEYLSHGFTLIELLIVVAIIALLSTLGVAMLDTRSSALRHAGGEIADLSSLARENALSQNAPTALIIITNGVAIGLTNLNSRALTVVQMDSEENWNQVTRWSTLPSTVLITNTSGFALPALPGIGSSPMLTFNGKSFNAAQAGYAYLFDTNGRLMVTNNTPARIRVTMAEGTAKDYYELIFNANTGTYKIARP